MKVFVVLCCLILAGCATNMKTARDFAQNGYIAASYEVLADEMLTSHKGDAQYARAFADEFPAAIAYGNDLFTEAHLKYYAQTNGSLAWIQRRLPAYCATNSPQDCEAAIERVSAADRFIVPTKKKISVLVGVLDQLTPIEQKQLQEKYDAVLFRESDVGVITDRQVENLSTPGSAAGSVAGAAVGSAAYNVNSVSSINMKNWTYSPWADLGSAILGAVVGSAANKAPVQQYRFRYGIKTLDGIAISVDDESQSAIGYPIGSCVYIKGFNQVEDSLCTMTVKQLRARI